MSQPQFQPKHLAVLAYAQGFTLWLYKAPVSVSEVYQYEFWAGADSLLAIGDMVLISSPTGSSIATVAKDRNPNQSKATIRLVALV